MTLHHSYDRVFFNARHSTVVFGHEGTARGGERIVLVLTFVCMARS